MRNSRYGYMARCPFWQSVIQSKGGQVIGITCEGLEDNLGFDVQTFLRFTSKKEMKDYFELFCAEMYETCPYYKAISRKYEKREKAWNRLRPNRH